MILRRRPRSSPFFSAFSVLFVLVVAGCTPRGPAGEDGADSPAAAILPPPVVTVAPAPDPPAFDPVVFAPLSVRAQNARVPVVMYHDIIKKRGRASVYFDCTLAEFKAQMDFLADQGAQPITLEQLHKHLTRGDPVPDKAIVLTFDDNYQGFFDNAYPILKERGYPAAMFVHTNFVGDKTGAHPKMTWDTLRALDKEKLVTIASHTLSHPDDMSKLPLEDQERELTESKAKLEAELGHPIPYFAYPNGKGDAATFDAARRAGYTLAFTIVNGQAEESPSILSVNRYIHTRLEKAWQDREATTGAPAAVADVPYQADAPVQLTVGEFGGVKLAFVKGGKPLTTRAPAGRRQSVGEFVQQNNGVAGINGSFFADAALRGTDNTLIGPAQISSEGQFLPELAEWRLPRLQNRPIVVWGPTRFAILPFQAGSMNAPDAFRAFMPDYTDLFVAGGWIVRDGVARTEDELKPFAVGDMNDPRRRAFLGLTGDGEVVAGGSLEVVSTPRLAEAAASAGIQEAVLLDSGFSTSLIYNGKIIVTGHTARNLPSRPVPHAVVFSGALQPPTDPDTLALLEKADPAVGAISAADAQAAAPGPRRRRRRHR